MQRLATSELPAGSYSLGHVFAVWQPTSSKLVPPMFPFGPQVMGNQIKQTCPCLVHMRQFSEHYNVQIHRIAHDQCLS